MPAPEGGLAAAAWAAVRGSGCDQARQRLRAERQRCARLGTEIFQAERRTASAAFVG